MIRINLLGEKEDRTGSYLVQGLIFIGAIFVTLLTCYFISEERALTLEALMDERQILNSTLTKLEKQTKKIEDLEKNRELLQTKLSTIAKLKAKKQGPAHLLDEISKAIPEEAWLESVAESEDFMQLNGIALDNQTIARFIANLDSSEFFSNSELIQSLQVIRDNIKLKEFALKSKIETPIRLREAVEKVISGIDGPLTEDPVKILAEEGEL